MGMIIGPTPWWQANLVSACPVGSALPDESRIICKAGGTAWIVSKSFNVTWGNYDSCGFIDNVGSFFCLASFWTSFSRQALSNNINPADWFIPDQFQFADIVYTCRFHWNYNASVNYWSSTENDGTNGGRFNYGGSNRNVAPCPINKSYTCPVIGMRCVTY